MREIQKNRPYRHFKGNLYYVHNIAMHTETGEMMISYQALYEPYGMFVRPYEMFASEVEAGHGGNITAQKYRFELFDSNIQKL